MKSNWQTKKLNDVCEILIGGTPSRGVVEYWKNGTLPWVSIADMTREGKFITETKEKITEKGAKDSNVKLISKDTLLFSFKLSIGKLAFAGEDLYTNEAIAGFVIKNKNELDKNFLYYFLQSSTFDTATSAVKGSTLNKEKMKVLEIPLPPLEAQKEIVKMLDEKMGNIGEAKRFRAEALVDTEKILSQTLHEIFEEGKKNGWEEKEIKDVCEKVNNINPEKEFDDKFLYVDIASVYKGKGIVPYEIFTTGNIPSRARRPILINDVLFALTRPYLKNIAIVEKEFKDAVASTGFSVMRAKKNILNPKYLYYVVNSDEFMCKIIPLQKGATYPAVSESQVFLQKIALPPLAEQQKIVAQLDALSEKVRTLRDLQTTQLDDLKSLEKAYLREAFSEKLV